MNEEEDSLQNNLLNLFRHHKLFLSIFLQNGVRLEGILVKFDPFCLLLKRGPYLTLIYKNAISTIVVEDLKEKSFPSNE